MKKLIAISGIATLFLFPSIAFATQTLQQIFAEAGRLIDQLTPIIVALALLAFFWGLAMYLFSLGGTNPAQHSMYGMPATPQNKQTGRNIMMWGIIAFFVMMSIWGLVNVLQSTFRVYGGSIVPPAITNPYNR